MNLPPADLLVIGGASLDVLHFAGQTVPSAGGAGMYTAMAARRAGVRTTIFAPRPDPLPGPLRPVAERVNWLGPVVPPERLPRFEIAHYGGGRAALVDAFWGAEAELTPQSLPSDLSGTPLAHIAALGTTGRQLAFLRACRQRGARRISAGTYGRAVYGDGEAVRALFDAADIFFMNENEAAGLFGSLEAARTRSGALLFVTLRARGALVVQGDYTTSLPGLAARELDPTGAGDAFCGATLAGLLRGEHPVMAARQAMPLAAEMIAEAGPAALLRDDPPPVWPRDPRVALNPGQIARVAPLVAALPQAHPFDFTGPDLPPAGHPAAADYFFAATLQQFSFWEARDGRYHHPLIAPLDGAPRKGSDYLWRAYLRPIAASAPPPGEGDPPGRPNAPPRRAGFYAPAAQAALTLPEVLALFRADDGGDPMPAPELHLAQANAYGRDMLAQSLTPAAVLAQASRSPAPLRTFLALLDGIGGYKEDPLRKKSTLLAIILQQRPEGWLRFGPDEGPAPIIDYHLMRSCLRTGLLEVTDPALRHALVERRLLSPEDEWAVRRAAYEAVGQIVARSGKSMGAVDWFFFNARRRCPEMTEPDCPRCAVDPVCAHHKALFQPVRRTTFY